MPHIFLNYILVFFLCFISTFFGSLTGGGALVAVPGLIFLGFPPVVAIATERFGSFFSIAVGLYKFHQNGSVNYKVGVPAAIFTSLGALIGANILVHFPKDLIHGFLGGLMLVMLVVMFLKHAGLEKQQPLVLSRPRLFLGYGLFFLMGILGGLFGGMGTFISYTLMFCFGVSFLESAGTRKLITLSIAIVTLPFFSAYHLISWSYAPVVVLAMMLGSYFGVRFGIKKGNVWVRRLFALVIVLMAVKLIAF